MIDVKQKSSAAHYAISCVIKMATRNKIIASDLDYIVKQSLPWETFQGKTVLISGASGFLPSYMVETFIYLNEIYNLDIAIIGLVRDFEKAKRRFAHAHSLSCLTLIRQDICQPIHIDKKIDFIIHAASHATPKVFEVDPVGTILPNVIGTNNLLELGKRNLIDLFFYFSTTGVHGFVKESDYPIKENCYGSLDPMKLSSCYLESKKMGENLAVAWWHQHGVPIKVVRPAITYGPGLNLHNGRSFEDFVSCIVNRKDIELYSDGSAIRNYCYIADAVFGFFTVFLKGKIGEAYSVATDHEISIKDLAYYLVDDVFAERKLKVVMKKKPEKNYMRINYPRTTVDITKIKSLGWDLKFSLREGFIKTVESIEL
ncbi:MAG: NAD-dependent epimerase/dehydratase family protein [Lamprobacter sp.]|uniref:NAD-dependent epimerase/dehydratase family protein n=1 Tax=Lamprobacter sp. TaxID=3100796 RepID=UPI002B2586C5|nr:NAD-dependent epimerase/dehydratase family protein [Lamprobacter sp.]MEA3641490.1 NAD-dependent epimerase/dehydratase family protein [Lamprobacter sp.]